MRTAESRANETPQQRQARLYDGREAVTICLNKNIMSKYRTSNLHEPAP
jgi:hypothetical protein